MEEKDLRLSVINFLSVTSLLRNNRESWKYWFTNLTVAQWHEYDMTVRVKAEGEGEERYSSTRLAAELRQLLTLKQHYYPEGGWGWVVLWTGALGQLLGPGLQGAAGVLGQEADRRFGVSNSAGSDEGNRESFC
ncbi:hypothetical protein FOCC_FOCC011578 [Frankliniella occidentalis]|nr:hypothetical protein FOCC_FOCC011578 [Frankliniella occidentalis]